MRTLILVKHAQPAIVPDLPAREWRLSAEGRRRCEALAAQLAAYGPATVVASREPKAAETGRIVAERLGWPFELAEGLHEHDRSDAGFLTAAAFEEAVARLFAQPDARVFGRETANQARDRFTQAVEDAIARHPTGNLAIVAHGTVIALFVAHRTGIDGYGLWRRLGLPSFVVLLLPEEETGDGTRQRLGERRLGE